MVCSRPDGTKALFFPGIEALCLRLDDDGHAHVGVVLLEGDDVLVAQADAALTGTARHRALVVGAAVDADAAVPRGEQTQEPVPVGLDVAAPVLEVVPPGARVLDHGDFERLPLGRLGGAHVALALLVALVLAQAARVLGQQGRVLAVDTQVEVFLRDDDKRAIAF